LVVPDLAYHHVFFSYHLINKYVKHLFLKKTQKRATKN